MAPIALHTALDTPPDEHRTAADCFSVASGDNFRPPKRRRNGRRFPISSAPVFRVPRRRDRGLVDGTHPLPDSTSAIRVCQPGPVAFQFAITSGGSRSDRSLRGFCNFGRPPANEFRSPIHKCPMLITNRGSPSSKRSSVGSVHVETTLLQRVRPLHAAAGNAHGFNVATLIEVSTWCYQAKQARPWTVPLRRCGGRRSSLCPVRLVTCVTLP